MSQLDKIKSPIKEELDHFESYFRDSMKTNIPLLDIILNYLVRRKGKLVRPMFVFLSARLLGETNQSTYTAASLIELLHNATLIHDDVVDKSYKRRGHFSINALWKSKISVLVGDYLLSRGLLLSVRNKEYDQLEIVSNAVKEMSEGEMMQVKNKRKIYITEDEYFNVITKKTASLIASCTACGARSVSDNEEDIDTFRRFGEKVGIAFQIKDDLLDYERSATIGKPAGNDIKEKKVTLPLIYALNHSEPVEKKEIKKVFSRSGKNGKEVSKIMEFVRGKQGLEYAHSKMEAFKEEALGMIETYSGKNASYDALVELVKYTVDRQK
ncbi:MAG: polyprenyl synthetase family protein [Bacteroidales bacterium]